MAIITILIIPIQKHKIAFLSLKQLQFPLPMLYTFQHIVLPLSWLSLFIDISMAYARFMAKNWIQAAAVTCVIAAAMPDPWPTVPHGKELPTVLTTQRMCTNCSWLSCCEDMLACARLSTCPSSQVLLLIPAIPKSCVFCCPTKTFFLDFKNQNISKNHDILQWTSQIVIINN